MDGRWEHLCEMATRKWNGTGSLKPLGFAGEEKTQLRRQGDFSTHINRDNTKEVKELIKLKS